MRTQFLFCFLVSCYFSSAQPSIITRTPEYKYVYYLNTDLASVSKENATVIGRGFYEKQLFRLDCFSSLNNRLLMTLHFKDSSLADLEGPFRSYHANGMLEKEGNFINGIEEGAWFNWNLTNQKTDSIVYTNGIPWVRAQFNYHKDGSLSYYELTDSMQNTYQTFSYDGNGRLTSEVYFKGQRGVVKTYDEKGGTSDSVFTRELKEAHFPGGDEAWRRYLYEKIDLFSFINKGAVSGKYTVMVKFKVMTDGTIADVETTTKNGYGMEEQAIKIIQNSPRWIPAVQYGHKVIAYRIQPITFAIDN